MESPKTDLFPRLQTIYLYLAGSCNLNCRHCWINPTFGHTLKKFLPWTEIKKILEEAKKLGLRSVKLTGGEPLIHPEFLPVIHGLRELKFGVTLETNGTLLTDENSQALKKSNAFVSVSLDGTDATTHDDFRGVPGAFEKTMKGISCLKSAGQGFQVIFSLHRRNEEKLLEMPEFARKLGAHSLKINVISESKRSGEMEKRGEMVTVPEILEWHKKLEKVSNIPGFQIVFDLPLAFHSITTIAHRNFGTCGIINILGILHDGSASLCGIGEHIKELNFGKPLEIGLDKIWHANPVLQMLRESLPDKLKGICGKCKLKHYCLGKCVANNYFVFGDLLSGFQLCEMADQLGLFPASRKIPSDLVHKSL